MPMHDWTRVDAGIYHDFHGVWLYRIRHVLNNGVLPAGYYALTEQVVYPFGPDMVALQPRAVGAPPAGGGTSVAVSPPPAAATARAAKNIRRKAYKRLGIRHTTDHRVVAVIELMSPGNKSARRDFDGFLNKAVTLLDGGVNLLVIDPFPPTVRDPNGVHAAVWKALTQQKYAPPPDKPLTAASYAAGEDVTVFLDPFGVGMPVPSMSLFLTPDEYVNVPLEATYQAAFAEVPDVWRTVLETP
jgi:hypothetical protein